MRKWLGGEVTDGEEVEVGAAVGLAHGLEEDHSVIYHHGKDLDGFSEEEHVGISSEIHGLIDSYMATRIPSTIQPHTLYLHIPTTIWHLTIIPGGHTRKYIVR